MIQTLQELLKTREGLRTSSCPLFEYQSELSPEDSDLASTFSIGESENCEYKNVEEFLDDLDHERASKIIKECFENAMKS